MAFSHQNNPKKIFISTIGSRGEVQPILALACELQKLGHHPIICVPPTFQKWVELMHIECVTIGPDVKKFTRSNTIQKPNPPKRLNMREILQASVVDQFAVTEKAALNCDVIVTAGDLQHAARSVAEAHNIPYVHALYCPATLKSIDNTPPNLRHINHLQNLPASINQLLWCASDRHWNSIYRKVLNTQRAGLGLKPIDNVPKYIATQRPWLAVDPYLGPTPTVKGMELNYTGAWLLDDSNPLPHELEQFLADGEPPIYFGFGSMGTGNSPSKTLLEAARSTGRRAIISRGWGNLDLAETGKDCFIVGDVNHQLLFPRVATIIHHGGAGTTTAAAIAGKPQIIVPHIYDQHYWANRVTQLRIGCSTGKKKYLNHQRLIDALKVCFQPTVIEKAQTLAKCIDRQGAYSAAVQIIQLCTTTPPKGAGSMF